MDLRVSCVILTAIHWEGCFLLTNINHYALRETYGRFNDSAVGQNSVPPWVSNTNSMRHFALHPQSLTVPPWRIVVGRRSFPIGARSLFRAFPIKLRVGNSESFICLFTNLTNLCLTKNKRKKLTNCHQVALASGFDAGFRFPWCMAASRQSAVGWMLGTHIIGELPQMLKCIHAHAHDWDTEIQYSISMKRIYRERKKTIWWCMNTNLRKFTPPQWYKLVLLGSGCRELMELFWLAQIRRHGILCKSTF